MPSWGKVRLPMELARVEGRGLVKMFGATRALAGVDLVLAAGQVTVIEGPNGSGKSTLAGILSLMVRPTRGEVLFEGEVVHSNAATRAQIGVVAHAAMAYPDLSAQENLQFYAGLHGVSDPHKRIAVLRERFEIGSFGDRAARTYSRGQLQRLALARALLHAPQLLLLDEPSTGLDARSVEHLVQAIEDERKRGAIVVLITHDSAFGARVADRRLVMGRGKVHETHEALR